MRGTIAAAAFGLIASQAVLAGPALAADPMLNPQPMADQRYDIIVWVGGGIELQPDYDGSDNYEVGPLILFEPVRFPLPFFGTISNEERRLGLSIGPSFRYVGSRDEDDNAALRGLGDVDATFEFGLNIEYEAEFWRAFAAGRYGFFGHEGFVGDLGIDVIAPVAPKLTLTGGPRLTFGDDNYFDAYFSVDAAQAAASGLPFFNAGSGLRSVGVEGEAIYKINDDWRFHVVGGYDRLVGDAADSPIVTVAGSEDQFHVGIGLSYRLKLDLFD